MKLFHGTYEKVAPIIKIGEFAMSGNNVLMGYLPARSAILLPVTETPYSYTMLMMIK